MSSRFDTIKQGLEDALAYERGDKTRARVVYPPPVDIKELRNRLRMTQKVFAASFMIPLSTLRNWEQGLREPEGPTRAYLNVIAHNPEAVLSALEKGHRA